MNAFRMVTCRLAVFFSAASLLCPLPAHSADALACKTEEDLPNFEKVSESLYRGGQPTREGFVCLQKMGIKTVIDVRGNDEEPDLIDGLGFNYYKRRMKSRSPSLDQAVWFLRRATNSENAPVFLHCAEGSHRTGWLTAVYRVAVEGWPPEKAVAEMTAEGTGFDNKYPNLVEFVLGADFSKIKRELQDDQKSE